MTAGTLFDRFEPRATYTAGLLALGAAFYLASSLGNLWEFYLFVGVMIGVGVGLVGMVPASALITRWYRERLSSAIGITFAAGGMGGLLFVLVFGLCMGVRGPLISSIATRHFAGPRVATIYGTIYSSNAIGAAFGSLMGGVLHDLSGGYRTGFVFSLCVVGLAVMPFWSVRALRDFR